MELKKHSYLVLAVLSCYHFQLPLAAQGQEITKSLRLSSLQWPHISESKDNLSKPLKGSSNKQLMDRNFSWFIPAATHLSNTSSLHSKRKETRNIEYSQVRIITTIITT